MSDLLRTLRAKAQAEGLASKSAQPIMQAMEEIERLRAELEEARRIANAAGHEAVATAHARDTFKAQGIGYLAERDELRAALDDIASSAACLPGYSIAEAAQKAREALGEQRATDQPDERPGRECGACGHWIPEGGSTSCSRGHEVPTTAGSPLAVPKVGTTACATAV